jgi:hypothetical protein
MFGVDLYMGNSLLTEFCFLSKEFCSFGGGEQGFGV